MSVPDCIPLIQSTRMAVRLQVQPTRHPLQFFVQQLVCVWRGARLMVAGLNQQSSVRTIGLEVNARNDLVADEQRQNIIAVDPLFSGHIDLDAVSEPEQSLGPIPRPDQWVEWRKQGLRLDAAWAPRGRIKISWLLPSLDMDRRKRTFVNKLVNGGSRL
jgi:hypothetical protein